jgi:hypothetical protein
MMRTVRLEVARSHEFPEGSAAHGYELHVPLTAASTLDRDGWMHNRQTCSFRRFWGDEEDHGQLLHRAHGWALSFAPEGSEIEAIFRADDHRFVVGEYVSIKERDGVTRTFKVTSVK